MSQYQEPTVYHYTGDGTENNPPPTWPEPADGENTQADTPDAPADTPPGGGAGA